MEPAEGEQLISLLRRTRWAALAAVRDAEPLASWVAIVAEPGCDSFLLHLSRLALHTRYLRDNPKAALGVSEADADPTRDPQTLARVNLQGRMTWIERDSSGYADARADYIARLPHAAMQFDLADFTLARFVVETARFVPGFGRVYRVSPQELRAFSQGAGG